MRVLLDVTSGAREDLSGIGRYIHELLRALDTVAPEAMELTLGVRGSKWSGRDALPRSRRATPWPMLRLGDWSGRWRARHFDVLHGLDARLPPGGRPARFVTLHDVFSAERSDLARARFRTKKQARYRAIARSADRIVCVSAATREAFLSLHPEARPRCVVVPHGVGHQFRPAAEDECRRVRHQYGIDGRCLLFVGLLSTRKNLLPLLDAFERIAGAHGDVQLVLVGQPSHGYPAIEQRLAALRHRERVVCTGYVPLDDLPALYTVAEVFVFPSLAEGFGLPVLEAMACGTAVLGSDLPVLHEVGGPSLRTTETRDAETLADVLDEMLCAPGTPSAVTARIEWAQRFRWERSAEQTIELWRHARGSGADLG